MTDAPQGAAKSKLTVPRINPTDSVVGDWVMVDMVREVRRERAREGGREEVRERWREGRSEGEREGR